MQGIHLIADFYDCPADMPWLRRAADLQALCVTQVESAGLTPLSTNFHQFEPGGATGVVILAESHLAIHTWPEAGHVTLDVFVCNYTQDNSARAHDLYRALESAFAPQRKNLTVLERGHHER